MLKLRYASRLALIPILASPLIFIPEGFGADITVNTVLLKVIEGVSVPAQQEGQIKQLLIREGDVVEANAPLVQIDDERLIRKGEQIECEVAIALAKTKKDSDIVLATKEKQVAESSLQRAMESRRKIPDTPSQAEVDEIQLRVAQAEQHLSEAKHDRLLNELTHRSAVAQLALLQLEIDRHLIRSPIAGVVVENLVKQGEWIKPGQSVMRVVQVERLRAEGFVAREHTTKSLLGKSVSLQWDDPTSSTAKRCGKVVFVSPEVDPNDNRQRIAAEIDNRAGKLAPGLRVKMIVHEDS